MNLGDILFLIGCVLLGAGVAGLVAQYLPDKKETEKEE